MPSSRRAKLIMYCVEALSPCVSLGSELSGAVERFSGIDVVGVCISARILMLVTDLVRDIVSVISLLAQSPQENVSPTYAEPKDGGRDKLCESAKRWSEMAEDGYEDVAVAGIDIDVVVSWGSGD